MDKLQVAGFLDNSLVNGKGLRTVLFLSGCEHNCKGCHNKAMQDYFYGDLIEVEEIFNRIKRNMPLIKGITFSGGEPFEQAEVLCKLAIMLKEKGFNIWCYTGYTFEEILINKDGKKGWKQLLNCINVLVDGRFEEEKKDRNLKYRGSINQRIIDVKESIRLNKVVLYSV